MRLCVEGVTTLAEGPGGCDLPCCPPPWPTCAGFWARESLSSSDPSVSGFSHRSWTLDTRPTCQQPSLLQAYA